MKQEGDLVAASTYLRDNYKADGDKIILVLPGIITRVQNATWVVWFRSRIENSLWRMEYCSMRAGGLKAIKPFSRNDFQDLARQSNTWIGDLMLNTLPLKAQHHTGHLQRFFINTVLCLNSGVDQPDSSHVNHGSASCSGASHGKGWAQHGHCPSKPCIPRCSYIRPDL